MPPPTMIGVIKNTTFLKTLNDPRDKREWGAKVSAEVCLGRFTKAEAGLQESRPIDSTSV